MNDAIIPYLKDNAYLTDDQVFVIKEEQKTSSETLCQIAIRLNFIEKETLLKLYANYYNFPYISLKTIADPKSVDDSLPAFIIQESSDSIHIVLEDPTDLLLKDKIKKKLCVQQPIFWCCGNLDYIQMPISQVKTDSILLDQLDLLLVQAVQTDASDIHIHAKENTVEVWYRLRGKLVLKKVWHQNVLSTVVNRLKILSNLDIGTSHSCQSGMFIQQVGIENIHFRVSIHPSFYGERIAIRLLNPYKRPYDLADLGFAQEDLTIIKEALQQKSGLILLTGATGSGKTTTLYACLNALRDYGFNIMTLEDPIECFLSFATQTPVHHQFTYADGIRSILRQDPDVILIGEIRDEETAAMAFRAAMTGHLVLTTLHTQSLDTIKERLMDLKVSGHTIDTFLMLSIIQSLEPMSHDACQAKGCEQCSYTGVEKRILMYDIRS